MNGTAPLSVTPHQQEVLEVLAAVHADQEIRDCSVDSIIAHVGRELFGKTWPAGRALRGEGRPYIFPTLNRTLGLLQRKGLVQREGAPASRGWWTLTPLGRDLLGLPPLS